MTADGETDDNMILSRGNVGVIISRNYVGAIFPRGHIAMILGRCDSLSWACLLTILSTKYL